MRAQVMMTQKILRCLREQVLVDLKYSIVHLKGDNFPMLIVRLIQIISEIEKFCTFGIQLLLQ